MSQSPIIIAILIAGFLIGDLLRRTEIRIGWKRIIVGSLAGGIGNTIYATAFILLKGGGLNQTKTENISFLISSFIVGFLIVLIIFFTAAIAIRILGRITVEEK
jgi:drug/metabolite transporter (DMT)-like permease